MTNRATLRTIDGRPVLHFERLLRHSPAKVWRAVTDPAEMTHWFPAAVEAELRPGAPMRFTFPDGRRPSTAPGRARCSRSTRRRSSCSGGTPTCCASSCSRTGDGCLLVFTQTLGGGWAGRLGAGRTAAGWDQCLDQLAARLDGDHRGAADRLAHPDGRATSTSSASARAPSATPTTAGSCASRATSCGSRRPTCGRCSSRTTTPEPGGEPPRARHQRLRAGRAAHRGRRAARAGVRVAARRRAGRPGALDDRRRRRAGRACRAQPDRPGPAGGPAGDRAGRLARPAGAVLHRDPRRSPPVATGPRRGAGQGVRDPPLPRESPVPAAVSPVPNGGHASGNGGLAGGARRR